MNADSLACWVEGGNLCERDLFRKVIPIKMGAGGASNDAPRQPLGPVGLERDVQVALALGGGS